MSNLREFAKYLRDIYETERTVPLSELAWKQTTQTMAIGKTLNITKRKSQGGQMLLKVEQVENGFIVYHDYDFNRGVCGKSHVATDVKDLQRVIGELAKPKLEPKKCPEGACKLQK